MINSKTRTAWVRSLLYLLLFNTLILRKNVHLMYLPFAVKPVNPSNKTFPGAKLFCFIQPTFFEHCYWRRTTDVRQCGTVQGCCNSHEQSKDTLPVNERALPCRVVTHHHHNDLFSGRQEPDTKAAGYLHQAWKHTVSRFKLILSV